MRFTYSKAALAATMALGLLTSILGGVASAAYANASTDNLSTFTTVGSVTGQISSKGSFAASVPGSGPDGAITTAQVTGQLGPASITGYKAATAAITTTATPSSTAPGTADFKFATSSSTMKLSVDGTLSPVGLAPASGLASPIEFTLVIDCVYSSGHWVWTITIGWSTDNLSTFTTVGSVTGQISSKGSFAASVPGSGPDGAITTAQVTGQLGPASITGYKAATAAITTTATPSSTAPGTADFKFATSSSTMKLSVDGTLSPVGLAPASGLASPIEFTLVIDCVYSSGHWVWTITIGWSTDNLSTFTTVGSVTGQISSKGSFAASVPGSGPDGAITTAQVTGQLGPASITGYKAATAAITTTATPSSTAPGTADFKFATSSSTMKLSVDGTLSPVGLAPASGLASPIEFTLVIDCVYSSGHWVWTITIGWSTDNLSTFTTVGSVTGQISSKGSFAASVPGSGPDGAITTAQVTGQLGPASITGYKAATAAITTTATPSSTAPGTADFKFATSSSTMKLSVDGTLSPVGLAPASGLASPIEFTLVIDCVYSSGHWVWTITIGWSTDNLSTFTTVGSVTGQISSKGSFAASVPGSGPDGAITTAQVTGQLGPASITGYKAATAAITTTATPSSTAPGTADFKFATSSSTMKLSVDGTLSPVGLAPASGLASPIEFTLVIDCVYSSGHWVWTITIGWSTDNLSTFTTVGSVTGQISSKGSFAASVPGSGPDGAITTAQVTGQLGPASITGYKAATAAITTTATPSSTAPGTADFKFATSSSTMKLSVDGTLSPVGLAPASGLASPIEFTLVIDCVYSSGHWVWTITIGWSTDNQ